MGIPRTVPQQVSDALEVLVADLSPLQPEPRALVLYGAAVRGSIKAGESEVPLAVVLGDTSRRTLTALAPALRKAWRAARVEPMIVHIDEVPRLADSFPIKVLELKRHGKAILGANPFAKVQVKPADVRVRLEQELRNHLMRLRRHVAFTEDDLGYARPLHRSALALPLELDALLRLFGQEPKHDRVASIYSTAAKAFALDLEVLQKMQAYEEGQRTKDPGALLFGLIGVLEGAVEAVDKLEIPA